jgi:hypothetical protein
MIIKMIKIITRVKIIIKNYLIKEVIIIDLVNNLIFLGDYFIIKLVKNFIIIKL